ncbi:hypothetical protein [Methylosinus sp. Sm6]|uniref:hypothetical protein n=1 Tax=Methylosinus sp. Sm6 TaxID=2866948 RepID=UPI001C999E6C|nr:hypothetical protein [Methylosinus sp. Sm6]MBY6240462.1 hypothetical protein [Methylosinus sp. Sm6]
MALTKIVHCLADAEPASYHPGDSTKPLFAINLSFECRSDTGGTPGAGEEHDARALFEKFLQAVQKVQFYVWSIDPGPALAIVRPEADQESETPFADPADLFAWLDKLDPRKEKRRYWSSAESEEAGKETEVDSTKVGATHRLRAAQAWNAPIAHKFALTHLLRPPVVGKPYMLLPYFADPSERPHAPTLMNAPGDPVWEVKYDPLGGFGEIICRVDLLTDPKPLDLTTVEDALTADGFFKVYPDADNLRRATRWFEARAASLTAPTLALALPLRPGEDTDEAEYGDLFEPAPAEGGGVSVSPVAAWAAAASLCAALDNLDIGMLKPTSEGPLLEPFVSALLDALGGLPEVLQLKREDVRGSIVAEALRKAMRESPLAQSTPDRRALVKALRHVHGLEAIAANAPLQIRYLDALLRRFDGDATEFDGDIKGNGLDLLVRALFNAEQRLQDEGGAEEAILRWIETSAPNLAGPPAQKFAEAYAAAINRGGDDALIKAVAMQGTPIAWSQFRERLTGPFNGAEAIRVAAGGEFLKAALKTANAAAADASKDFRKTVREANYFVKRLLGDDARPPQLGVFGPLLDVAPTPEFPGNAGQKTLVATRLEHAYLAAVMPLDTLFDATARFAPDTAPPPLAIQIAGDIDGSRIDAFAKHLNGVAVGIRRLDRAADGDNPWAHANLADLAWKDGAGGRASGVIHPMLPAAVEGRAPMFVEYQGFPFASSELSQTRLPDSEADAGGRAPPFYQVGSSSAAGFARTPRLAYGRRFQSFAFVTTNAGSLPLKVQGPRKHPWMPGADLEAPDSALIAETDDSRRTAIGQAAMEEVRAGVAPLRIGAPITGVTPLASDYPRIGLFADRAFNGARDLFRESDGRGALVIGSATVAEMTNVSSLTDLRWTGAPERLRLRFFDGPASDPNAAGIPFLLENTNALTLAEVTSIRIASTAKRSDPHDSVSPLRVALTIGYGDQTQTQEFDAKSDALWLRLVLEANSPSVMTCADVGARSPDGVEAPVLLMAPGGDNWVAGLSKAVTVRVHAPRVGYLDFDRWLGNSDLRQRLLPGDDAAKVDRFERALLTAYVMRHLDKELAAALDRLPDLAVEQLRLELVVLDQLAGAAAEPKTATFNLFGRLKGIVDSLTQDVDWDVDNLKQKIFNKIEQAFFCTVELSRGDAVVLQPSEGAAFAVKVPDGHVARLSVDALVRSEDFQGDLAAHPPRPAVFDSRLLQFATRCLENKFVAFPAAAVRIETMLAFTDAQKDGAPSLASDMIVSQPVTGSRRYEIVTNDRLPDANRSERTRFWRLIGEIDVTSQRWRPTGRPIYRHIAPRDHRAYPDAPIDSALPLKYDDGEVVQFEAEAFFDRSNFDAQTVTKALLPLPSRTSLQTHMWDAPSATYFRHRFTLRSRYAGALRVRSELEAWKAQPRDPATAWTMRVAMLAEPARILLTRPQLRALIPLTTAPQGEDDERTAPPILAVLQEPPFARGGLADRIDAEIKIGFGYGFADDNQPVEILRSRKEIGPTPYLDYRPLDETLALGMTLTVEGPVGLTFDTGGASAPAFPNSLVTLAPFAVGGVTEKQPLEEHFLGVSLRRHIDPEWTVEQPQSITDALDAERAWWIEFEPIGEMDLLKFGAAIDSSARLLFVTKVGGVFEARATKLPVDGYVAGAEEQDVAVARLDPAMSKRLILLHQPIAPERYALSLHASLTADTAKGRSSATVMLASFEWSPPTGEGPGTKPAFVKLFPAANARVRTATSSAPTFLAWTRISRDFDFVHTAAHKPAEVGQTLTAEPARFNSVVAMLTSDHKRIVLKREGEAAATWPVSSTFFSEYPLYVHRHLAALTTRYIREPGRPVETFCRSAVLAGNATPLTPPDEGGAEYPAEDCVRIVEFETPAAILCDHSLAAPPTYREAYFDLMATGFRQGGALRLLMRLVGPDSHVRKFASVKFTLRTTAGITLQFETLLAVDDGKPFAKALELHICADSVKVRQLRADGRMTPAATVANGFTLPQADAADPGLFLRVDAKGGGGAEFWTDVSLLHGTKIVSGEFDFDWLFGRTGGGDPAGEVLPLALRKAVEAQARIIAVSPPIPVVSHNESIPG